MIPSIVILITGILNAPAIIALVNKLLSRGKDKVDEEVTIGGEWQRYALQAKTDKADLEKSMVIMQGQVNELRIEVLGKNSRIEFLEDNNKKLELRVETLEAELERYHQMEKKVDEIKETAHQAVENVAGQIKEVIHPTI